MKKDSERRQNPLLPPKRRKGLGNLRTPEPIRQRRREYQEIKATFTERQWNWGSSTSIALGCLLLPWAALLSLALLRVIGQAGNLSVFRTASVWFFFWGVLLWIATFWVGFQGKLLYVIGHELTHAVVAKLFGGTVVDIKFSKTGGQVLTDKNNLLISLSPYFVPFWSVVMAGLYWLGSMLANLDHTYRGFFFGVGDFRWDWLLFLFLGFTWAMHLTYTVWMISKDQPDLWHYGSFFSIVLIYVINLLSLTALLIAASPSATWAGYWTAILQMTFGR